MIDYVTFALSPAQDASMPTLHPDDAMLTFAELGCWPVSRGPRHVVVMYVRRHPTVPLQKTPAFRRLFGRW